MCSTQNVSVINEVTIDDIFGDFFFLIYETWVRSIRP